MIKVGDSFVLAPNYCFSFTACVYYSSNYDIGKHFYFVSIENMIAGIYRTK